MKRNFDPSNFADAETEDTDYFGCPTGAIANSDSTCSACTSGTYANTNADPQVCTPCAYDTYSRDSAVSCDPCGEGLGTLELGSDSADDCISKTNH